MNNKKILEKLFEKKDITAKEIQFLLQSCIDDTLTESQIAAFLIAFRMKGETVEEISALIQEMRKHIVAFPEAHTAIDTCGTGGDEIGTFNISTTVAVVVAGAGVPVVKHGNKAASSLCGSADVLTELGAHIMLTPEQASNVYKKVGLVFLFAPLYHPALKRITPIRKELNTRTIFNILGPFLNPAHIKRQLIGVPNTILAEKLAKVAVHLGYEYLLIVASDSGMDEIALNDKTKIFEIKRNKFLKKIIDPSKLGFRQVSFEQLKGGTASENANIVRAILLGKKNAKRDIVILNSAYALLVAGKVNDISEGIKLAERSIDSGAAKKILENFVKETQKYAK